MSSMPAGRRSTRSTCPPCSTASRELRRRDRTDAKVRNAKAIRVYRKLVDLIESGDAEATEKLWQRHMEQVLVLLEEQSAAAESVIDVLD